jgi:poly(3-hydroxybutyrate) depolymerase
MTTTTYAPGEGGAVTEFIVDRDGGHGWPDAPSRRDGNAPIMAFRGAERVWEFFAGKSRSTPTTETPDRG